MSQTHIKSSSDSLVSIITRTRDRQAFLPRNFASVDAQTFSNWEHLIVNDGGPSMPLDELVRQSGHRARVIHLERQVGMEAASNAALEQARGRLVIFLDDDDTWLPECLEVLVAARLAAPSDVRGVMCQTFEVREVEAGFGFATEHEAVWNPTLQSADLGEFATANRITNNAFLVDRDALEALHRFDDRFEVYGDWDFNLRFLCEHAALVVPRALARYHRRTSRASGTAQNSFDRRPDVAASGRARLVRLWLSGESGRRPHVGQLLVIGPQLDGLRQAQRRIDKLFDALHRVRRLPLLASIERSVLKRQGD